MSARWRSLPFVLLGLLTVVTLGAPLALWLLVGREKHPDHFKVWVSFGATTAVVAALMVATITASLARQRAQKRSEAVPRQGTEDR